MGVGVGRPDYSKQIDHQVQPVVSHGPTSHQSRVSFSFKLSDLFGPMPTLTYPDLWWLYAGDFAKDGSYIQVSASDTNSFIQQAWLSGDTPTATTAFTMVFCDQKDNNDNPISPLNYVASVFAPGFVSVNFSKGLKRIAGKYLFVGMAVYSAPNPTADMIFYMEEMQDNIIAPTIRYL